MADFNMESFINSLKNGLYDLMPRESGRMRDIALLDNPTIPIGTNSIYFELGNGKAEEETPHYHILQDAQVITKKGRATKITKGSQSSIADLGSRDYGVWTAKTNKKGKLTMFQEYNKNVRGSRSKVGSAQRTITNSEGKEMKINRESKYYVNEHYHYIENILEKGLLDQLASEFNLTRSKRTSIEDTFEANMVDFGALLPMVIK
jgi:hypothetical protein